MIWLRCCLFDRSLVNLVCSCVHVAVVIADALLLLLLLHLHLTNAMIFNRLLFLGSEQWPCFAELRRSGHLDISSQFDLVNTVRVATASVASIRVLCVLYCRCPQRKDQKAGAWKFPVNQ